MSLNVSAFRYLIIVSVLAVSAAWSAGVSAQDAPVRVSCQITKITANGKEYSQVQYAVFKSLKRAVKVKNELVQAVASEVNLGATGMEIQQAMDGSGAKWKDSRPNGTFDVLVMTGQAVAVFCDRQEVHVFEITEGKTRYEETVRMRRSIGNVIVDGKRRIFKPTFKKVPSMDTGYETQFSINVMLPEGWTKDNSRLIIQPMAMDCQTDDTVAYLQPVVYEGMAYHDTQDKRMGFDYFTNDPLARGYRGDAVLRDNEPFAVDTTVVFRKPDKDKTYKGIYYCVLEDYHREYYNNGGEGTGSCLAFRPFKFLDFSVAAAQMDIAAFKVEAESQFTTVPRNLQLKFEESSDRLTSDSVNDVEFGKLLAELKSYGDRLFRVRVEGSASPDGNYEKNKALAAKRAARALAIVRNGLGRGADVQLPAPTVRVYTWKDVLSELEHSTSPEVVEMVRNVIASNEERNIQAALRALPFYGSVVVPVLEGLRVMRCSYSYERDHVMTPGEAVEAYFSNKEDYLSGKKQFSDGDYYNLFATVRDSAELDVITELAYRHMKRQPAYEKLVFSPYVANRMALLNMRRGVPDPAVLAPFIDFTDKRIPARKYESGVPVTKNFREMLVNQAIIYFQEQKLDTAQYIVDWIPKDGKTERLEKFINFERYFIKYIQGGCTPEEEKLCSDAYAYVVESNDNNKAIIFSELHTQLGKTREEAEAYVDKMDDKNAKKWYLKGILWSEEAGKEPPVGMGGGGFKELSDAEYISLQRTNPEALVRYNEQRDRYYKEMAEAREDKVPHFLAYFQHSFDLEPKYRRLYYNEGNVSDDIREKYEYKKENAPAYRKKFGRLMAALRAAKPQVADKAGVLPDSKVTAADGSETIEKNKENDK